MSGRVFRWFEFLGLLLLLGVDQLTKMWAQQHDLVIYNQGGVLGVLPSGWWILVVGFVLSFVVYEWWHTKDGLERVGMALLMTGGIGNSIDRLMFGAVRDFIYYPGFGFYGNVADIILGVGVGVVVLGKFWGGRIPHGK